MNALDRLWRDGWLRNVDHALADSLRRLRPDTPEPALVAIALTSLALAQGHSRLPLRRVDELLTEIASDRDLPDLPGAALMIDALRASPWIADDGVVVLEDEALSLRRYWRYETALAAAVRARLDGDARLLLLTGGPGTGKTTRVAQLLTEALALGGDTPPRIALAAPTGKAAGRLGEAVREQFPSLVATTLHRLLGWQPGTPDFVHHAGHPLPFDLVVVDEASMVDLPMMAKLFAAVAPSARLVLVGDRDQLPSVETGDVLAALCDAITEPPARLHLSTVHRQSADTDLGRLAAQVRDGEVDAALRDLGAGDVRGVDWLGAGESAFVEALQRHALPAYRAVQQAPDVATALAMARRLRVLTAVREGPFGSRLANARLAAALDPARRGDGLFAGKMLIVIENSYRQGLFNGDIGIAWPGANGEWRIWFESADGPRAWLPAALPAHEPAFALTVHKAQGSEFDAVLLALPERGARVLSRELLYTGLTRCKQQAWLCASEGALREAIGRRAQRWSGLAGRLLTPPGER